MLFSYFPTNILQTTTAIQQYTKPDDVLLLYGLDWSSVFPYYSERRAVMDTFTTTKLPNTPLMQSVLKELADYNIGAMVFCLKSLENPEEIKQLTKAYKFESNPIYTDSYCQINLPKK